MPIDYKKYHPDWKKVIRPAILERDNYCCSVCGVENYNVGFRNKTGQFKKIENSMQGEADGIDAAISGFKIIRIVLTISHIDHNIKNNDYENLKAMCQKCHLSHDKDHHKANTRKTITGKKKLQELPFNNP